MGPDGSEAGACARMGGNAAASNRADTLRVSFIGLRPWSRFSYASTCSGIMGGQAKACATFGRNVEYRARPVNREPDRILPRVTGIWFQSHQLPKETGACSSMPAGITNMLTMECSKPWAKNVRMGSHMAAILPVVERDTMASSVPTVTIQLQSTALTSAVAQPAPPAAM